MRFDLTDVQASFKAKGETLGRDLGLDATAADAVMGAARAGLLERRADLVSIAAAVEAVAHGSPSAAMAIGMHSVVASAAAGIEQFGDLLFRGEMRGALALSSEDIPTAKPLANDEREPENANLEHGTRNYRLSGRASWVAPVADGGLAIVGARSGDDLVALAVPIAGRGVSVQRVEAAGLRPLVCAHLSMQDAEAFHVGATIPVMARLRVLIAAVGLGIGRRALQEALVAARAAGGGAAGEQTVQGLLADAATELDAALMLTWKAATEDERLTLSSASMAKLAATGAAQRAIERTTQVVGVDTFRAGHVIERLAQDVRALELFAGRTEALRAAVAEEVLPQTNAKFKMQNANPV
jgi:alkylation response protein AidB-like acyl-CoA dehydrogenase